MIKNGRRFAPLLLVTCAGCDARSELGADADRVFQGVIELEEIDVGFEYPGRLAQLWVERGDQVAAGQRLAAMDDALEQAATRARQSETAAARARVEVTRAGSRPEEKRALEARIRAADASIRELDDNLARETTLLASGVTPQAVVDDLRAQRDRAVAERDALAQNLDLLIKGPRREEVAALQSQAEATLALLDAQRERAQRFELHAPISGVVLDHHYWPGEFVAQGAVVVTLADPARPYAEVFVPEPRVASVQLGGAARVRIDGLDAALSGRVEHIARQTEFTPRYLFSERERPNLVVRVRVRIDDPEQRLRAGVPARVELLAMGGESTGRGGNGGGNSGE